MLLNALAAFNTEKPGLLAGWTHLKSKCINRLGALLYVITKSAFAAGMLYLYLVMVVIIKNCQRPCVIGNNLQQSNSFRVLVQLPVFNNPC